MNVNTRNSLSCKIRESCLENTGLNGQIASTTRLHFRQMYVQNVYETDTGEQKRGCQGKAVERPDAIVRSHKHLRNVGVSIGNSAFGDGNCIVKCERCKEDGATNHIDNTR